MTLGLFAVMPLYSGLAHWFDSEQRNHWFGYWFGHDMFTPPFKMPDGKPIYPEMTKDAVLFGGTDPGRFCPTYMIFCESFTPHDCQPRRGPEIRPPRCLYHHAERSGRRHLPGYIRAHYNRSAQIDPPFFSELLRNVLKDQDYRRPICWRGRSSRWTGSSPPWATRWKSAGAP